MFDTKEELIEFLKKKNFQKRIDKLAKKYANKKVMIYGAGMGFLAVKENYDLSKLNIIGIADKKFDNDGEFMGYKTYTPDSFMSQKPDIVLIGMIDPDIAESFFEEELYPEFGKFKHEFLIKLSIFDLIKMLFK
ncbi:MAG: hypothetical protein A2039_03200 [Candidatus Melainabacteria bacterium GWA2_34_9]|nr:MAG: hypothetical protein A2039_03200 [Candidatus Melainabacteria bacterium GWA2_34_9]